MSYKKIFFIGFSEYLNSIKNFKNWIYLGFLDILLKYRRSVIGPWWSSITTAILIVTLSFLWSKIFNLQISNYVPYFTTGYILWIFFSNVVLESCTVLNENALIIKQTNIPICSYILRNISKNIILFLHNSVVLIIVISLYININLASFMMVLLGLLIFILISFNIAVVVSIISSRFNDFAQLVINLVQITFFLTPIIWEPTFLKDKIWVTNLNPLYHWIEIIRSPLLNQKYDIYSLIVSIASLFILILIAIIILGITHKKISKWI